MIRKSRNAFSGSPAVCLGNSVIGTQFGRRRSPLPQCVSGRERGGVGQILVSQYLVHGFSISVFNDTRISGKPSCRYGPTNDFYGSGVVSRALLATPVLRGFRCLMYWCHSDVLSGTVRQRSQHIVLREVIALLRLGSIVRLVKLHGWFGAGKSRVRVIQRVRTAPECLAQIV